MGTRPHSEVPTTNVALHHSRNAMEHKNGLIVNSSSQIQNDPSRSSLVPHNDPDIFVDCPKIDN